MSVFYIIVSSLNAFGLSEGEKTFLTMYFSDEELVVVSATRSLQSITRIAENIEVVTGKDIELMNAHTLSEVLNRVTGVQVQFSGPIITSGTIPMIQAAVFSHVVVLVDGVAVNNTMDGSATVISYFPVQAVEKIEIIKGPASSAWGSALGGIINIITKTGESSRAVNGTLSTSYGEKGTADYRAEAYGTKSGLSYYLFAGDLRTDGLRRNFNLRTDRFFSNLSYELSPGTKVMFSLYYDKNRGGEGDDLTYDLLFSDRSQHFISRLALQSRLSRELTLEVSLRTAQETWKAYLNQLSNGAELSYLRTKSVTNGASAKLTWMHEIHTVVGGVDYDHGTLRSSTVLDGIQSRTKWGSYINDTLVLGKFAVTPGIRFDSFTTTDSIISPSLGMTYQAAKDVLLRATIARGFSLPTLYEIWGDNSYYKSNRDLKVEKVWSYQAGVETTAIPNLWVKVSAFRHEVRDAISDIVVTDSTYSAARANLGRVRRQGLEGEIRTASFFNTSFFGGATFIDSKDLVTGQTLRFDSPRYTFNAGLKYDDKKSLRAFLAGHYIWWNEEDFRNARYNAIIVDLSVTKTVYKAADQSCDIFVTGHNLFNGSQYVRDYYPNAHRWVEAGVRYKF